MSIQKRSAKARSQILKISVAIALMCISVAYGQKGNLQIFPNYKTVVVKPQFTNAASAKQGLAIQNFTSSLEGEVIYVPHNLTGSSVVLFIDRKSGEVISRTSYDFGAYFTSKRRSTDVDDGPDIIADPCLSADGGHVIFKHLLTDQSYQVYALNLKTNEISRVSKELLAYSAISVSPDGNYVAFIEGGDAIGYVRETDIDREYYTGPLKLFVANSQGESKQLVAQGDYLNGDLEWSNNIELLYGAEDNKASNVSKGKAPRLNIYGYDVAAKKSTLLIENGIMPHPAKDGKHIVFFGPPNKDSTINWNQDWREKAASGLSLLSTSKGGVDRIAFEPVTRRYPIVQWSSDSTQFVSLRQISFSPIATAQLHLWNIETQNTSVLAELKVKDSLEALKSSVYPRFDMIGSNSTKVLFSVSEYLGFNSKNLNVNMKDSVYSVQVASGEVKQELTAENILSSGYDVRLVQ